MMMPRPHRTPISRIPPEILAEILLLCAPLRYDSVSERRFILFPSQVCHYWRSTALSTPALWTFISFICTREEDFSREEECAQVWLSRSSQCPLSIDLTEVEPRAEEALQIFLPHCTRWKDIGTQSLDLDPCIWLPVTGKLPSLEEVDLPYGSGEAFAIAPCLRLVRLLFEEPLQFGTGPVKLPWTQLAQLELNIGDDDGFSHVREILQQASNIVTLTICSSSYSPGRNSESTILTHPNISTLRIICGKEESNGYILDGLALPALRILRLSRQWRCATSLLSRSACSLASLDTRLNESFDIEELVQLPLNNSLSHWRVGFVWEEEWETMVECLTHRRNFNNLRSLEMDLFFTPSRPIDMVPFADMVASRWRRVDADLDPESARCALLSHVRLFVVHAVSMDHATISHLRTFAAEGLDIEIRAGRRDLLV